MTNENGGYVFRALTNGGEAGIAPMDPRLQKLVAFGRHGVRKATTASTMKDEVAVLAKVSDLAAWENLSEVRPGAVIGETAADGTTIVTARIPFARIEHVRVQPFVASLKSAGVLLLLFAAQVVHSQRERLMQEPGLAPLIAQTYALLGQTLTVPTDLSAYELRQWGAANDPDATERLLLRASIVNRASHAQPYPLLRLALQDRFGATLGLRDIEPKDYLPGAGAPGLLGPGQRADAEIRIVDPGREAVGFEMDICVPVGNGVRCANQVTTAAQ